MKKVIIGLSGGVDSSVSAYLLKQEGYDVEAVFMRNWDSATNQDVLGNPTLYDDLCEQEKDYMDAKRVADFLNIKLHKVDFIEDYWDRVFAYFLEEYKKNRTPNPDVLCNNEIKFKAFIDYAKRFNPDYIAMGHYARIKVVNGVNHLQKGLDNSKDQSYFLSQLKLEQLNNVLFPIGNLTKAEVRKIANDINLPTANKKDSTGICFIGERHFNDFLANYLPAMPGEMKKLDGTYIKKHNGLMNYTIGQRKGLGIGGTKEDTGAWYVVGKDLKTNTLYVEPNSEHINLYSDEVIVKDVIWRGDKINKNYKAKFRYRQEDIDVELTWLDETSFKVYVPKNARAVTPGQVCAIYENDLCIGSGFIDTCYYKGEIRRYS